MPPEIVVGIVGVETIYGRQMGNFRVIDALATLAFDFPAGRKDRSAFFRDELESWFVLCKSEGIDPLAWKGSYAGAIGMAQFMPSSFNRYAVDFDGDGHVDLHDSAADVIGSVAHYLAEFGWKRGLPTHFDVAAAGRQPRDRAALLAPDIVPTFSAAEIGRARRALPPEAASVDSAARAGRAAERRRRAELRRRHEQLLRDDALQLVELLRDGGDRAGGGGAGGARPRVGQAMSTAALASTRPAPVARSEPTVAASPSSPSIAAASPCSHVDRRCLEQVLQLRGVRAGFFSSMRAHTAATCGAAADVPLKRAQPSCFVVPSKTPKSTSCRARRHRQHDVVGTLAIAAEPAAVGHLAPAVDPTGERRREVGGAQRPVLRLEDAADGDHPFHLPRKPALAEVAARGHDGDVGDQHRLPDARFERRQLVREAGPRRRARLLATGHAHRDDLGQGPRVVRGSRLPDGQDRNRAPAGIRPAKGRFLPRH